MIRRTIFWDVDTQIDFMEPNGKLPILGAASIRKNLSLLTNSAPNIRILSGSVDAHTPKDREFKVWPEHCVYGTPGQRKIPESTTQDPLFIPSINLSTRQLTEAIAYNKQILFEKQHNNVETNPNTRHFLAKINPEEVVIYGVATEICVDSAVKFISEKLGYNVTVAIDAIMGIDSRKIKDNLDEWRSHKVSLQKTGQILGNLKMAN